ncbi:MAG: thiol:disulfide interchange protein [Gammaproteobacteria bacterium]|nr:thiol:disulfide interchange protein [Gammaproteobacteria bacterium]MYL02469.1 thiol:disulfide interchange protein [Gammaproteobacteria bacterium]
MIIERGASGNRKMEQGKGDNNLMRLHTRSDRILAICAGILISVAAFALKPAQAAPVKTGNTQAELLAEVASVTPGQPFTIGLNLTPDPGWHTYWINPGDAGKPAQLKWDAPEELEFGELKFPAPGFVPFMTMMSYGYNGPTLLLVDVIQTEPVSGDSLAISARASWLVCDDQVCIPERANLTLEIPVSGSGGTAPEAEEWRTAAFAEARALIPQDVEWPAVFSEREGEVVFDVATPLSMENAASVYLFPEAEGMIDHTVAQQVGLWADRLQVSVPAGRRVARYDDTGLVISVAVDGAPRQSFSLSAQRTEGPDEAETEAIASLSVTPGGGGYSSPGGGSQAGSGGSGSSPGPAGSDGNFLVGFVQAIGFAVLGGLILNLMPCVLPILSLKALGVAQMAGESPRAARNSGIQFLAGVLVSFLVLAALIIALRQGGQLVGWAFHMQNPLIVAILSLVMVGVGLNLLGAFEVNVGGGALGGKATQGKAGEFFTGVLAVLVATPCTAPFMAGAIGYALVQPAAVTVGVFLALGLGFALPYFVVSFLPDAQRLLPRPGAWMVSFRQALAFPMFGTAIWLYWVLGNQAGVNALTLALIAALALGLGTFGWNRRSGESYSRPWRTASVAGLLVVALSIWAVPRFTAAPDSTPVASNEVAYSAATLDELRSDEMPVFAYFTADWCITCKVNENVALKSDAVREYFSSEGVQVMVGDWTNEDPAITEILQRHGRAGVPLYLYFKPGADEALVLPQILTPNLVIEAVENA